MKINRQGAYVYRGDSSISLPKPEFSWCKFDKVIYIQEVEVKDFSGGSRHNYKISLEVQDLRAIIGALASAARKHPAQIKNVIDDELRNLICLTALAAEVNLENEDGNRKT